MAFGAAVLSSRTSSPAATLIGVYARWTLWFLAVVTVCWIVGIEGIHGHPLPFYALIAPVIGSGPVVESLLTSLWIALALGVLAGGLVAARRWYLAASPGGEACRLSRRQLAGLVLFAIAFPVAVATIRGGPEAIAHAYSRQAYEYIGDIGSGGSIRGLFRDYEKIHPYLSMHAKVHPPGPIAILWLMSYVAGRTPMALSIATIVFGALAVIPFYYWAADVLGARRGAIAALVYTLVPTIVLFTATSADITFMPFTLTALCLFWRAIHPPDAAAGARRIAVSSAYALGAGLAYGLLGLISFSLLSIGVFFGLVGLWRLASPQHRVAVVRTGAIMLIAAIGLHYAVYRWSGYNSIAVFELAKGQFDADQSNLDTMDPRLPAVWWKLVNPMCWFYFAGIPVSVLCVYSLADARLRGNAIVWIVGLSFVALDLLYLARGEGERSAMYVMPFLVFPAALKLDSLAASAESYAPVTATLAFLGVQCIATECVLYTYW